MASVLESVVVHASGAVCLRRARCAVPPPDPGGAAAERAVRLRLSGLPAVLDAHSLRGRIVSGPAGLRVTDIRFAVVAELRDTGDMPALRAELEAAEDKEAALRDRRDRLTAETDEVSGLRPVHPQPRRGDPPRQAPVASLLAFASFADDRLALLQERLRSAEEELRRAEYEVGLAQERLAEAAAGGGQRAEDARTTGTAVLTLDRDPAAPGAAVDGGGALEIELEYVVPGAAWAPVYQLRLDRSSGADGALVLRACVAQRTGEDWSGVRLGLSTADLRRRTDLPELRSQRIGRRQERPASVAWREPPGGLEELFAGYDGSAAARSRPRTGAAAVVATDGAAGFGPVDLSPADYGQEDHLQEVFEPPAPIGVLPAPGELAGYGGPVPPPASYGAPPPGPVPNTPSGPPRPGPVSDPPAIAAGAPPVPAPPVSARRRAAGRTPEDHRDRTGGTPAAPPELPADLLDYARLVLAGPEEPSGRGKLRPDTSGPDAVVAEYRRRAEAVARLRLPAHAVDVRRSAGSFDYRFDTVARVDVVSDGVWHTVPVCEVPVRLRSEYVCVPAVDEAVYETVLLTNDSGHALLAGPADVSVGGDFLMTVPLPTLAPGELRRVGLGVAESVRAARTTHMRESTAGLRGGTTVLDHRVEVELANRLDLPVTVEVRERVPVSSEKDVRIDEHRAAPPWTPEAEAPGDDPPVRGGRVWRVELEPGRTTTLSGGYAIRIPAGKALAGGNRRD